MKELYIHSDCGLDRYYKVAADTLEDAQRMIIHYEEHIYDLYGGDTWTDEDTWGWWKYGKYEIVNYEDIEDNEEIDDLTDYKFDFPEKFCKTFKKGEVVE